MPKKSTYSTPKKVITDRLDRASNQHKGGDNKSGGGKSKTGGNKKKKG